MGNLFKVGNLSYSDLRSYAHKPREIALSDATWQWVQTAHDVIYDCLAGDKPVYGVNTGFGQLSKVKIDEADLSTLQTNLVLSHACGVGESLSPLTSALILLLKINGLAQGYSGISRETLSALIALYNLQLWSVIPSQGSVGASGDLAPLAHLVLPLLHRGSIWQSGKAMPAAKICKKHKVPLVTLKAKEGLALLNGTQVSTAMALEGVFGSEILLKSGVLIGALTVDVTGGSDGPFDTALNTLRGHPGQRYVAEMLCACLQGSEIRQTHTECVRVQDPYSLRCQPQVMGACWDQWEYAKTVLVREANGVSDNPLVFPERGVIISGGNFHAQSSGMAADSLAVVISEIGALSERRIALMMDPNYSGLPAFLAPNAGLNSGLMILQYTAAALASENKSLCFPASADSIPTSNNQEDHVSMAPHGARRLAKMVDNTAHILAIELICACQALEFVRPLCSSVILESIYVQLRKIVPSVEQDRELSDAITEVAKWLKEGALAHYVTDFSLVSTDENILVTMTPQD